MVFIVNRWWYFYVSGIPAMLIFYSSGDNCSNFNVRANESSEKNKMFICRLPYWWNKICLLINNFHCTAQFLIEVHIKIALTILWKSSQLIITWINILGDTLSHNNSLVKHGDNYIWHDIILQMNLLQDI